MKKLFCIVVAIAMVLGLVACTSAPSSTEMVSAETSKSVTTEATSASSSEAPTSIDFPEMKLVFSAYTTENSIDGDGVKLMKDLIEKATDGKVTVDLNFGNSLFTQDQELDAMMKGNLDIVVNWYDWLAEYMDGLDTLTIPYLFKNCNDYLEFYNSDIAEELNDNIAQELGIHVFAPVFYRGVRTVNLTKDKKVTSREDLENVKFRMPNSEAWLFIGECLGANSIPLGYTDMYLGLQTGTIDGQDNSVTSIRSLSLYEVTKSVTMTGHMISPGFFSIRDDLWQSLSPELQQIIDDAMSEAATYITETIMEQEVDDIQFMEGKGLKVYRLTDEELSSYRQEVIDYYFANVDDSVDIDMDLYQAIQDMAN